MGSDRPLDMDAIRRRATEQRTRGLAPKELLPDLWPGAVFTAKDEAIQLPESRLSPEGRSLHETRRVIVVGPRPVCIAARPPTLLVIPCSASWVGTHLDLELPLDAEGFDKHPVWAFPSLVQPILKSDLVRFCGRLERPLLDELLARVLLSLDISR